MKTVVALVAAGLVFCGVAVREWSYRSSHPYALGPSGELIALAVGGAVIAFALATYVYQRDDNQDRTERALWGRIGELHAEIRGLTIAELELRQIEQEMDVEDALLGEPGK